MSLTKTTPVKINHKSTLRHKAAVRFGIWLGCSVLILGLLSLNFQIYFQNRIYPFIYVAGISVGGLTPTQAEKKINNLIPRDQTLILNLDGKQITLKSQDINAVIQSNQAAQQAFSVGRGYPLQSNISLLVTLDEQLLTDKLQKDFNIPVQEPVNAAYTIENNSLAITPSKSVTNLNSSIISSTIKARLLEPNNHLPIEVVPTVAEPLITTSMLQNLMPNAQAFIETVPNLLINNKKYQPTLAQKASLIKISILDGQPSIAVDEDNLKSYLENISKKTTIAAKPDIYFTSGELSETGKDGLTLDLDNALVQYKQSIESKSTNSVELALTSLPKTKKVIDKPFTPGMFEGKYIEIDLSSQKLFQFEGTNLVATHGVSTGKWSTPTPIGTFWINAKSARAYSATYKLYMPYWMSFIGGKYGIHELPEWPDGRKEGAGHIGTPVSHGCIRLGVGEAQQVYDWSEVNTPVVIHK